MKQLNDTIKQLLSNDLFMAGIMFGTLLGTVMSISLIILFSIII